METSHPPIPFDQPCLVALELLSAGRWRAMDATTRQRMALHVGERRRERAKALWGHIPAGYQHRAMFHMDQYAVYNGVMPTERHPASTKHARQTNPIEWCNHTLSQRLSRLVRATLSCSKQVKTHIGASKFFICHYNLEKGAALPL